jgi:non-specific serine/threonine protein kinase
MRPEPGGDSSASEVIAVTDAVRDVATLSFPPIRRDTTLLIGREDELARLRALIDDEHVRLITLTGAGGIGKTRLAIEAAAEFANTGGGEAAFVSLGHLEDATHLLPTIAATLRIPRRESVSIGEEIAAAIGARRVLLALDNLEHLLDGSRAVLDLLAACPGLTVLATSRVRLHVRGEHAFRLQPLGITDSGAEACCVGGEMYPPAVALFVARASELNPNFTTTPERELRIADICRRLDGLPLAIEIAAARSRVIAPEAMLPLLEKRLGFLAGGSRDAPERQRTIRNTIQWTYDLLPPDSQRLLRWLSIFPAGFTLEAVSMVAGRLGLPAEHQDDVLLQVELLADHSLLKAVPTDVTDESRFTLYEMVRAFGLEALEQSGESEDAHELLIEWSLSLAKHTLPGTSGAGFRQFDVLEAEFPNVRSALTWLRARGEGRRGLKILQPLTWFMTQRYLLTEATRWATDLMAMTDVQSDPAEYAAALNSAARIHYWYSEYEKAKPLNEHALELWRSLGATAEIAQTAIELGTCLFDYGEVERATALLEECIAIAGDDHPMKRAHATVLLARFALAARDFEHSRTLYDSALSQFTRIGQQTWVALTHEGIALWHLVRGDVPPAREGYLRGLSIALELDDYWRVGQCTLGIAEVLHREGDLDRAIRLYSAATAIRIAMGIKLRPTTNALFEQWLAALKSRVPAAEFERVWAEGAVLSRPEAAAIAMGSQIPKRPAAPVATPETQAPVRTRAKSNDAGLTPREREILGLLSQGLGNREIAERLYISHRTVMQHIANIFPKIDVTSRTAAAAWAHQHQIL